MTDEAGLTHAIPVQGDWASTPSCAMIQTQSQPAGKLINQPSYNSSTDFSLDLERDIFWSPFEEIFNPQDVYSSDRLRTSPRDGEDAQQGKHLKSVSVKVSALTTSLMDELEKQEHHGVKKKSKSVLQEPANPGRLYSVENFVDPLPFHDNDATRINIQSLGHSHHRASFGGMNEEMLGSLRTVDIIRENLRQEGYHNLGSGRANTSFHPNFSVAIGDHVELKQKKSKKQKVLSAFSKLIRCSPLGKARKKEQAAMQQIQAECKNSTRQIRAGALYLKRQASLTKTIEEKLNDEPLYREERGHTSVLRNARSVQDGLNECHGPLRKKPLKPINTTSTLSNRRPPTPKSEDFPSAPRSPGKEHKKVKKLRLKMRKSMSLALA